MNWLSILSWNVRGLASSLNRSNVRNFVQLYKPSMVCLQESMCKELNTVAKRSLGVYDISCWAEVAADGLSG